LIGTQDYYYYNGNAYLYKLDTHNWTDMRASLIAAGKGVPDYFGTSVALTDTYALVGSQGIFSPGDAYLYKINNGSWTSLRAALIATGASAPTNYFGQSVALSNTYAMIGGDGTDVYLYKLDTATWTDLRANLIAYGISNPSGSFGAALALSDTYALIGSSNYNSSANAYLYRFDNGAWTSLRTSLVASGVTPASHFGMCVALSSTYALIGSNDTNNGAAYLYKLDTGSWSSLRDSLVASGVGTPGRYFGSSVGVSNAYALVGNLDGGAYLYDLSTHNWKDMRGVYDGHVLDPASTYIGSNVALSSGYALIGTKDSSNGNAYLYDLTTRAWTDLRHSMILSGITSPAAYFGNSVALSDHYALIGSGDMYSGDAYLYNISSKAWTALRASLTSAGFSPVNGFGMSVALSDNYALIGTNDASTPDA